MSEMEFSHAPVLLTECIEGLDIKPDGVYVDATTGGAGHSLRIASALGSLQATKHAWQPMHLSTLTIIPNWLIA